MTFNFIYCWIKHFRHNYQGIRKKYNEATKNTFKQISTKKSKPLSQDKNDHMILADIGVEWYTKKIRKNLPPPRKKRLLIKSQKKIIKLKVT